MEREAKKHWEEVYGTVQCYHCEYWGRMDGFIDPARSKTISFVCPNCDQIEEVENPE